MEPIFFLFLVQGCTFAVQHRALPGALFSGAWQGEGSQSIRFEPDRILVREGKRLSVRGVEEYGPHSARVRRSGKLQTWFFGLENGHLHVKVGDTEKTYRHLEHVPPLLVLEPLPLGLLRLFIRVASCET
jgi:hypothetical protein